MIGKTLSHYKILDELGAGGMGVVYRAHDERLGRDVALKLLPAESLGSESARRALENEARTASALNHPNICTIHDVGEVGGQFYVAMEYVEGRPLAQLIPAGGLPPEQVMGYGTQIADALAHGEQRGIVHRDLKSANVVVTPEGRAKVLDFGLAQRARREAVEEITRSKVSLEVSRGIAGTLAYMAPEALRGEAADARGDIWALGVVLYEMVAGELPFRGATGFELSSAILRESPRTLPPHVPAALRGVIQRCLAKDPAQRYQRAGEVKAALEAIGTSTSIAPLTTAAVLKPQAVFWRFAILGSAGVLTFAALLLAFNVGRARDRLLGRGGPPRIESIAVLPLANMSGDPNQEYFADGMTEALITELAQLSGLKKVTSRTSVMLYKAKPKPMPEIAKELGVDAIIEGSVQRAGDKVGITVQLIDPAADRHLWAKSYERDARDILTLQREVARSIAEEIRIKLTPQQMERLGSARPVNPAAYEAYLRGRQHWDKRTTEEVNKSIAYFQLASEKDPGYALAYAGLADSYNFLGAIGVAVAPPKDTFPKAKAAAQKALELDANLADAHTALAYAAQYYDWDWQTAEREYQQALELSPGFSRAHQWYSHYLMFVKGQPEQSIAEALRARELDPLAVPINVNVAFQLYFWRKYDEAVAQCRKTLELDPNFLYGHWVLGLALEELGKYSEAVAAFGRAVDISGHNPAMVAALAHAYAASGNKVKATKMLRDLEMLSSKRYVPASALAIIHAALGHEDQSFQWLEKAYAERSLYLVLLKVNPKLDSLRADPRFQSLLHRMNFPQ